MIASGQSDHAAADNAAPRVKKTRPKNRKCNEWTACRHQGDRNRAGGGGADGRHDPRRHGRRGHQDREAGWRRRRASVGTAIHRWRLDALSRDEPQQEVDRKSTRLNSSHQIISYAVFCLKKKKKRKHKNITMYEQHYKLYYTQTEYKRTDYV